MKGHGSPAPAGSWAPSTVHPILSDPVYIGTAYANRYEYVAPKKPRTVTAFAEKTCRRARPRDQWIANPGTALVDQETWDRAQAQMARNALVSFRNNKKHNYLLRCPVGRSRFVCGSPSTAAALLGRLAELDVATTAAPASMR